MPIQQVPPGLGTAISGEEWASFVLERLGHASVVLRSGARRLTTSAPVLHVPRFTGDGSAGWYLELEELAEGAPPGDDIELIMRKCATLAKLSNEVVADASRSSINQLGETMMSAVGLETDKALLVGQGPPRQPVGILGQIDQVVEGDVVDLDNVIDAAGLVGDVGGEANALYLSPGDWTAWQKVRDGVDRPLLEPSATEAAPPRLAGLSVFRTPALGRGTAVVAQADQIVVAVRDDPSVQLSDQALFTSDGHVVRITTRLDVAINDKRGLAKIVPSSAQAATTRKR